MSNSDLGSFSPPNVDGTWKLEEVRASSEARRRRILGNAEARLQAIAGGLKPPKGGLSVGLETTSNSSQECSCSQDSPNDCPTPITASAKPSIAVTQEPEAEILLHETFFKNRFDFLLMICFGLVTRLYLAVNGTLLFNLFGAYALIALPLVALSAHFAPPSASTPGLHRIILETVLVNGQPFVRRVSLALAIVRIAFEYLAGFLFSFILAHVFLAELNTIKIQLKVDPF